MYGPLHHRPGLPPASPSPRHKDALVPRRLFNLRPFFPVHPFLHGPIVPQASSSSAFPCKLPSPSKDTTRPVSKISHRSLWLFIRPNTLQHSLVDCPTVVLPLAMTLMKWPTAQAAGDAVSRQPALRNYCSLPPSFWNKSITPPHLPTFPLCSITPCQHADWLLHHCLIFANLQLGWFC